MRSFRSNAFELSVEEEATDGKVSKEIEHMFYAKVVSPESLLKAASCEIQEQWGLWQDKTEKNAGMGSNRIRKTISIPIVDGQFNNAAKTEQYVLTTKLKTPDGANLEVPLQASEDSFKAFRIMAESGMIKHRYSFPVENSDLVWEVDMFVQPGESHMDSKYIGWAKIDLEVKSKDDPIPPFPHGFSDAFNSQIKEPTPEQQAVIDEMKPFLSLPNPYVKETYPGLV